MLDQSFSLRIGRAWVLKTQPVINNIVKNVISGDFTEAYGLVKSLDIGTVVAEQQKFFRIIGMSSILYGAVKLKALKEVSFVKEKKEPLVLSKSLIFVSSLLSGNLNREVQDKAINLISTEEIRVKTETPLNVDKSDPRGIKKAHSFVQEFSQAIKTVGIQGIDLAGSLYSSRLASWGFTTEAALEGVQNYAISEQLDNRICPICREMHGKVFSVSAGQAILDQWLSAEDPNDVKSISLWPKQDANSVEKFSKLTNNELIDKGWNVPPFHPLCRGVLVETTKVPNIDALESTPKDTLSDAVFLPGIIPADRGAVRTIQAPTIVEGGLLPNGIMAAGLGSLLTFRPQRRTFTGLNLVDELLSEGLIDPSDEL